MPIAKSSGARNHVFHAMIRSLAFGRSLICTSKRWSKAAILTALLAIFLSTSSLLAAETDSSKSPEDSQLRDKPTTKNVTEFRVALLRYGFTPSKEKDGKESIDIVLIPPQGDPMAWRVPIKLEDLNNYLRRAYRRITSLETTADNNGEADPLYKLLVSPVIGVLEEQSITTLLISADRGLQAIPFAALFDGHHYFGERFSFSITPSLALTPLAIPSDTILQPAEKLSFASTRFQSAAPLPLAEAEINRIAADDGNSPTFINEAFTTQSLLNGIRQPTTKQIHIASHAEISAGDAHVLTGNGQLTLRELNRLDRSNEESPLDLVYFSACRTAIGNNDAELGFSGLALQIGSTTALGSLWNVNDLGSAAFAVMFYRYLATGLIKAEAALAARQAMIRGQLHLNGDDLFGPFEKPLLTGLTKQQKSLVKLLPQPYFWAGTTVLGSPW